MPPRSRATTIQIGDVPEFTLSDAIIVFARAPYVGQTKTRLIAGIGARAAAELYATLLTETLQIVEAVDPIQRYLYVDSHAASRYFAPLIAQSKWENAVQ